MYRGTPQVKETLETTEWPRVYRERNERQEHSFKRMIDYGALNTNYGRKKDYRTRTDISNVCARRSRSHSEACQKRVDKKTEERKAQQDKVVE